jgi:hypothetical protein
MPKKTPKLKFETLKGRAQQIVTQLTNAIAFFTANWNKNFSGRKGPLFQLVVNLHNAILNNDLEYYRNKWNLRLRSSPIPPGRQ